MAGIEDYLVEVLDDDSIPLHGLRSVLEEVIDGNKTQAQAVTAFETKLPSSLSSAANTDLTDMITWINGGVDIYEKKDRMDRLYRIFSNAQHGYFYATRTLLRTRLDEEMV